MEDLRLVEIKERHSMSGKGIIGVIGMVVGSVALLAVGYYVVTKFFNKVDTSGFTADQNTTFGEIQTQADDAIELSGFAVWVAVAAFILAIVLGAFASMGA